MKKIIIICILIIAVMSFVFSGDFENNLKNYIGKDIRIYVKYQNGSSLLQLFGILEEINSDYIKIVNKEYKLVYFIKLSDITTYVVDVENPNKKK